MDPDRVDGRMARECPRCDSASVMSRREAETTLAPGCETVLVLANRPEATHICTDCKAYTTEG